MRGDGDSLHPQRGRRLRDRDVRTAIRPATPQRQVHAQSKFARPRAGEFERVEKLGREVGQVAETVFRIVQRQRIYRLHFKTADPALFHRRAFRAPARAS